MVGHFFSVKNPIVEIVLPVNVAMDKLRIAIVGAGPSGLLLALYLSSKSRDYLKPLQIDLFDREPDHHSQDRSNPDRSYTIDITGHGLKAVREIGASLEARFDRELIRFTGIHAYPINRTMHYEDKGWTGSRGDICSALLNELQTQTSMQCSINTHWQHNVMSIDAASGKLQAESVASDEMQEYEFDLIVAADGAGSSMRRILEAEQRLQTRKSSIPNYSRILHLDNEDSTRQLDPTLLHVFSLRPWAVGGAILDVQGENLDDKESLDAANLPKKFFAQMGFADDSPFSCEQAVRQILDAVQLRPANKHKATKLSSFISDGEVTAYSKRPVYHTGKTVLCSQLACGRCVLLGDAATAFPPVGQGVNAAMESAAVLGEKLCATLSTANESDLTAAANAYSAHWLPQAEACAAIANTVVYGSRINLMKLLVQGIITQITGIEMSAAQLAKDQRLAYRDALRIGRKRNQLALAFIVVLTTVTTLWLL